VYRAALVVKEALRGEPKQLARPVVSVGSVSAGGAGKTPVVIALAQMLKARGWDVDVLSRGYGRSGSGVELVVGTDTARYGDEPVIISQRAEVPVWVGADRFAAGESAEAEAKDSAIHLLDDGMQHRQLARAVDVVLVTFDDLDDALLPAGNLREPLHALSRADFVAVREEEMDFVAPRLKQFIREGTLIWTLRRKLRFPEPLFVLGAGLRPVALCAIARPEGFEAMLREAGCGILDTIFFRDHHAYDLTDMVRILELARKLNATGFVTTEKDAVKLTTAMREKLETLGPVMVTTLDVEFVFPERVARELEAKIGSRQ
jgi:tetraacyldisaccharide 4'-kinase